MVRIANPLCDSAMQQCRRVMTPHRQVSQTWMTSRVSVPVTLRAWYS